MAKKAFKRDARDDTSAVHEINGSLSIAGRSREAVADPATTASDETSARQGVAGRWLLFALVLDPVADIVQRFRKIT